MTSDRRYFSDDSPDDHRSGAPAFDQADDWTFDGIDPRLTADLSAAFRGQAESFEPSNDAYRRLAESVGERTRPSNVRWIRPLAVAAALVATVGLGASLFARQDTQRLGTGPGSDEVAVDGQDSSGDGSGGSGTDPAQDGSGGSAGTGDQTGSSDQGAVATGQDPAAAVETVDGSAAEITGPVRTTQLDAARAFLDLLRLPYGTPEIVDGRMMVRSYREGGVAAADGQLVATLTMASVDGGYAVVEATTESIVIDEVADGDLAAGSLAIGGSGSGYESQVGLRLVSALDNRVLAVGSARAGNFGQSASFVTELAVVGAERGWVVVSGGGGADGVIDAFAARPVSYRAGEDTTNYAVVRVPPDDPDGGLHLRTRPGRANQSQGVLPAGSVGIRRTGEYPVLIGTELWWSISTADGAQGWVNSRFLASAEPVTDAQLTDLAQRLGAGGAPFRPGPELPVTRRAKVAIGTLAEPTTINPDQLRGLDGWTVGRSIPVAGQPDDSIETSLVDFHRTDLWDTASIVVGGEYATETGRTAAQRYFGTLPVVVITPSDSSAPRTFIFAESTPAGPEIVGLLVERAGS